MASDFTVASLYSQREQLFFFDQTPHPASKRFLFFPFFSSPNPTLFLIILSRPFYWDMIMSEAILGLML
jgi:hypothetical protein